MSVTQSSVCTSWWEASRGDEEREEENSGATKTYQEEPGEAGADEVPTSTSQEGKEEERQTRFEGKASVPGVVFL